jgi:uncharacterized membrane protein
MRRGVEWLEGELPELVERGVLTAESAESLRRYYASIEPARPRVPWGQILLSTFGALLVGGGLILILAHNWDGLGRPARAAVALGMLVAAQALAFYATVRRAGSMAWAESTSALLVTAVGAAISLVGQTYHVGGSFEGLMQAWLWLIVLIPYFTGSTLASIGFWALLVVRAAPFSWREAPWDLWVLVVAGVPFVAARVRRYPDSWATTLTVLAAAASIFIVGSMATIDVGWTGQWALFQVSFLAALLAAASWPSLDAGAWRRRVMLPSSLALIAIGTILTFDDVWRSVVIVERVYRNPAVIIGALISAGCAVFAAMVTIRLARAGRMAAAAGTAAAIFVVAGHASAMFDAPAAGWIAFNVWLLIYGILTLVEGIRTLELGPANRGLLALAALVIARFFDTELSFLARGLVFVAFGVACLVLNLWLMRRARKETA